MDSGDATRTRDIQLGRFALYLLSYSRSLDAFLRERGALSERRPNHFLTWEAAPALQFV